jgi:predicted aspartyl protease
LGETYTKLKIYGANGVEELMSLVDTGATFTKVPLRVGKTLGLKPRRKVEVKLSDERSVERALCYAEAEMDGVRDLIPITLGGEEPLIGYTALEILGFKINPITRRLERTSPIEYYRCSR